MMEIQDVPAKSNAAHAHDICVILDNTWATPLFYPPHQRGADIAIVSWNKIFIWSLRYFNWFNFSRSNGQNAYGLLSILFAIGASPRRRLARIKRGLRTMALRLSAQGKSCS